MERMRRSKTRRREGVVALPSPPASRAVVMRRICADSQVLVSTRRSPRFALTLAPDGAAARSFAEHGRDAVTIPAALRAQAAQLQDGGRAGRRVELDYMITPTSRLPDRHLWPEVRLSVWNAA